MALIVYEFFILSKELNLFFFMLPKIKKLAETKIKKRQTIISFLDFLKISKAGDINKEIQSRLNEYVPIIDKIWIKFVLSEKLNAIKFQGKPVSIDPLINSIVPNKIEKIKNEPTIFFE